MARLAACHIINAEAASLEARELLQMLRAFLLLYEWLCDAADVNLSRRIVPFIDAFPETYVRRVLDPAYDPDVARLIEDYIAHNPTRNRPLDMLSLFACVDPDRVLARTEPGEHVNARPAFHYRLANCRLDDPGWRIAREWNLWTEVEHLAADEERVREMSREWFRRSDDPLGALREKWAARVSEWLE